MECPESDMFFLGQYLPNAINQGLTTWAQVGRKRLTLPLLISFEISEIKPSSVVR